MAEEAVLGYEKADVGREEMSKLAEQQWYLCEVCDKAMLTDPVLVIRHAGGRLGVIHEACFGKTAVAYDPEKFEKMKALLAAEGHHQAEERAKLAVEAVTEAPQKLSADQVRKIVWARLDEAEWKQAPEEMGFLVQAVQGAMEHTQKAGVMKEDMKVLAEGDGWVVGKKPWPMYEGNPEKLAAFLGFFPNDYKDRQEVRQKVREILQQVGDALLQAWEAENGPNALGAEPGEP